MNRTKEAGRAKIFILISILIFVCAAASSFIPRYGDFLALGLAVFAGFLMMIGAIIRDQSRVPQKKELEPQAIEELF